MANKKSDQPLSSFVVSVDQIEKLTGVNFFPQLPDGIENKLEAQRSAQNWNFGPCKANSKNLVKAKKQATSSRLKPYTGQCCGKTQSGSQCKRKASAGSRYCWQHKKK